MELQRFGRTSAQEEIWKALETDGGAIVEGFVPAETVDRLLADFQPHLDAVEWCNTETGDFIEFFGQQTKRLHGLLARSPGFSEIVTDPLLKAMCDHFLKARCHDYRVSTGELMALGPGEKGQMLHRDADSWLYFPQPRPELLVSSNLALTDFTSENGATVVVPGSHLWPAERKYNGEPTAKAIMPRGSALLYTGNVLHGGGTNTTDATRIGMYTGFNLSWLRPLENHLITNGEESLHQAPADVQRLLGMTESGFEALL